MRQIRASSGAVDTSDIVADLLLQLFNVWAGHCHNLVAVCAVMWYRDFVKWKFRVTDAPRDRNVQNNGNSSQGTV